MKNKKITLLEKLYVTCKMIAHESPFYSLCIQVDIIAFANDFRYQIIQFTAGEMIPWHLSHLSSFSPGVLFHCLIWPYQGRREGITKRVG